MCPNLHDLTPSVNRGQKGSGSWVRSGRRSPKKRGKNTNPAWYNRRTAVAEEAAPGGRSTRFPRLSSMQKQTLPCTLQPSGGQQVQRGKANVSMANRTRWHSQPRQHSFAPPAPLPPRLPSRSGRRHFLPRQPLPSKVKWRWRWVPPRRSLMTGCCRSSSLGSEAAGPGARSFRPPSWPEREPKNGERVTSQALHTGHL